MEKIKINGNEYYFSYARGGEFSENLYIYLHTLGDLVTEVTTTRKYLFFGEKQTTSKEVQKYNPAFSMYVGFERKDIDFDKLKKAEERYHKGVLMSQGKLEI